MKPVVRASPALLLPLAVLPAHPLRAETGISPDIRRVAAAQSEDVHYGESEGDFAGWSVAFAGDTDGNGAAEVVVGAWQGDYNGMRRGLVYLVDPRAPGQHSLAEARVRFVGLNYDDHTGIDVAGAGDVDGDGLDDVLIGARHADPADEQSGAVYLLRGPLRGDLGASAAAAVLYGEALGHHAGDAVAGAGDVNGDGLDDILVGANQADHADERHADGGNIAGLAYLVLGPLSDRSGQMVASLALAEARFAGNAAGDMAGTALSSAGDVDGDGFADILVAAPREDVSGVDAGTVWLIHGPTGAWVDLEEAGIPYRGEFAGDYAGQSLAPLGDVNGDGLDDFAVGAFKSDLGGADSGAVYVVTGGEGGSLADAHARWSGVERGGKAGASVARVDDLDGDGRPEVAVGVPMADGLRGAVYVVPGEAAGHHDLDEGIVRFDGETPFDFFGVSVASGPDLDGDGIADLVVGAYGEGEAGENAGAVRLFGTRELP